MEDRICGWHNLVQYGITASYHRIHNHGRGQTRNVNSGRGMFGIGAFVTVVAAAVGMGFGKRATTSEQDPGSKNWWEGQSE